MTVTIEAPKNIAETIIEEFRHTGEFQVVVQPDAKAPDAPFLIAAPDGIRIHDLTEQHRKAAQALKPMQRTGQAKLDDLDSIIEWTNRFKGKETVLFGQLHPTPKLVSVIDYHGEGAFTVSPDMGDPTANYGRHTALYTFPVSQEWKRWNAISGQPLSKDEFGEFIEENAKDFLDPTPALLGMGAGDPTPWEQRMIDVAAKIQGRFGQYAALAALSREFRVHETGHLQVTTNRDTGETQVQFLDEHRGPDGQPLRLPNLFMIAIPVFEEGALYRLAVRFRYRKAGQDVKFFATLYNPDAALRDAAREALTIAHEGTNVPLLIGTPEIGAR
ncbi:DUF2303 family protein [Paracoccus sp. 22332]|uniref:DUF2303 family protein n=1 Tax=Paracoccus sp. 22332 TaxID=3453913 RepID=UPI003F84FD91